MTFSRWQNLIGAVCLSVALAAAPSALAQSSGAQVVVQGAQQSNAARLVFPLPRTVGYSVNKQGTELTISFEADVELDFSAILATPLRQATNPRVGKQAGRTIVTLDVPQDAGPRDFWSGQYLVIDIYSNSAARVQSAANMAPAPAENTGNTEAAEPLQENEDGTAASDTGGDTGVQANDPEQQSQTDGSPTNADGQAQQPLPEEPVVQADAFSGIDIQGVTAFSPDDKVVPVSVSEVEAGIQLRFPWPEEVASAAFERGGYLWLVFDQPYKFDPSGLRAGQGMIKDRIRAVELQENSDALVMRLGLKNGQSVVVERDVNDWLISLKDTPTKPRFPLEPTRQAEGVQGQQIFVPATDIGRKIDVEDPAVGDFLVVLPMLGEGRGMAQEYSYASSQLLETAQGVVVMPKSDFVDVERFRDGIAIRSAGNNILSATKLSRDTGLSQAARDEQFSRLIDFDAWRIGEPWEYRKIKSRLFYELSLQPLTDRNAARWKLARFYIAHGRAAEAIGVLERMLDEDPLLAQNSEYLAVRGVANFKQGRLEAASSDLSNKGLEAEQDAELWRVLVAEALGQYDAALEHYRRGKDVMGTYDDFDRAEIQLAVVRAALELDNLELALRELDLLNGLNLNDEQLAESVFQSARIAARQGQMDAALAQFDDLTNVPYRWIAARARYAQTTQNLKNGDITQEQAIDQLERLRFAWRGARFEAQLLDDLADLYFDTKQYELGLEVLRQGVSYFPDLARDRQMISRSAAMFRELFLEGKADVLTPISAISLYYKFRDLTPLGAEGDLMIRRLADRLVSVDLLDRAAELLEYQVRVRTEGAGRALIAANLAKIYILNEQPNKALEIMRATREPRLPEDIDATRRHVETRALIELGRYEEAEVLLEGDRSREADQLKADIYWGSKAWSKASATIRQLLGDGWRRNEALDPLERLNLIRLTIALTFMEDRAGLIEMRRRYGSQMRVGDFANAFDLLTNDQELSGRELGAIAGQIASVEKLQSFMRDYRSDFSGR
ncbi:tetratricopeptide repeat protein [Kordiimonas sp.]|uniref:tetratricopeptide repeat protein n=1 Tax=Kordiimonas sp. TaxID=1970157 RepID=UPI003A8FCE23